MSFIIKGNARISLITPNVVRFEYSPSKNFEDRKSIRVMERPDPIPFNNIEEKSDLIELLTEELKIQYRPKEKGFTPKSLQIFQMDSDKEIWNPGFVDHENLGSVHSSMDYIKPEFLPEGVHPATKEHHAVDGQWNWWSFRGRFFPNVKQSLIGAGNYERSRFDEILVTMDPAEVPAEVKKLVAERSKYPPGLLSRSGYFVYNDSQTALLEDEWVSERLVEEGYEDLYFFYYKTDYKQALKDYTALFGKSPLTPRYALGLWYSRYPTFNDRELKEMLETFEKHELPLDMLVLDLEWHKYGWYGFDWDTDHINNPDDFLAYLRDKQIHTTFNIHPDGVPVQDSRFKKFIETAGLEYREGETKTAQAKFSPDEIKVFEDFDLSVKKQADAFMDVLHKPVQDQGVDFWWIDGCAESKQVKGVSDQLWTNHVYKAHIKNNYPERRPMIFSRTPGFGAHRYPYHFTGDTWSYWGTLKNQVEQTLRAGHIGQSYVTHDIGGHMSSFLFVDPELYVRWAQFAVLSPVVRLHSSGGGERRPWLYGEEVLDAFKQALQLRMELLPYLYSLCFESSEQGVPVCRSNCIEQSQWEEGYSEWSSYFLGDRIYAAPVLEPGTVRTVMLPPGTWYRSSDNTKIESDGTAARKEVNRMDEGPLHYYRAGTIMVKQKYSLKASEIPETLVVELYTDSADFSNSFTLYEDDGFSQYHSGGECSRQKFEAMSSEKLSLSIGAASGTFRGQRKKRNYEIKVIGKNCKELTHNNSVIKSSEEGSNTFLLRDLDIRTVQSFIIE